MKYTKNDTFAFDLKFGQVEGEDYIADLLPQSRMEVKADRLTKKTGNLYFEYESRGKCSGIATTKADVMAYKLNDGMVLIFDVIKLKQVLRDLVKKGKAKMGVKGGDNNTSLGILVSVQNLLKHINK